jgi:hypothetical protein
MPRDSCGLWIGAVEGKWELEQLAARRFFHRFGYRASCCSRYWSGQRDVRWRLPHFTARFIDNPQAMLEGDYLFGEQFDETMSRERVVKFALAYRDGFGRFSRRGYVWRPDFDLYMEWYERHLAECAGRLLTEREDVL